MLFLLSFEFVFDPVLNYARGKPMACCDVTGHGNGCYLLATIVTFRGEKGYVVT